jgi:hypothetical protein
MTGKTVIIPMLLRKIVLRVKRKKMKKMKKKKKKKKKKNPKSQNDQKTMMMTKKSKPHISKEQEVVDTSGKERINLMQINHNTPNW